METDEVTTPAQKVTSARRIRQIGERFAHPVHGELMVATTTWGCAGCVFTNEDCCAFDNDRETIAGACSSAVHGRDVVFAKPNDYAVFKLTGEWP